MARRAGQEIPAGWIGRIGPGYVARVAALLMFGNGFLLLYVMNHPEAVSMPPIRPFGAWMRGHGYAVAGWCVALLLSLPAWCSPRVSGLAKALLAVLMLSGTMVVPFVWPW